MNSSPPESQSRELLTTRARVFVGAILTLLVVVQSIRSLLHPPAVESDWVSLQAGYLHGWLSTVVKVGYYLFFCWIAFLFIRDTKRSERLFFIGWLVDLLLSPAKVIGPTWALTVRIAGLVGLLIAFVASLLLLLSIPDAESAGYFNSRYSAAFWASVSIMAMLGRRFAGRLWRCCRYSALL